MLVLKGIYRSGKHVLTFCGGPKKRRSEWKLGADGLITGFGVGLRPRGTGSATNISGSLTHTYVKRAKFGFCGLMGTGVKRPRVAAPSYGKIEKMTDEAEDKVFNMRATGAFPGFQMSFY